MNKKITIFTRDDRTSKNTEKILRKKLDDSGYEVTCKYCDDADLLVCIGGDGTFLEAIHKFNFPSMPIIGINTGHLGFFQEIMPSKMDDFIFNFSHDKYSLQPLSTVKIKLTASENNYEHIALNEVIIKNSEARSVHLNMEKVEIKNTDFQCIICADAGYLIAQKLKLEPDILIGDYDSMPQPKNRQVIKLPVEKDMTDSEAAIDLAVSNGYTDITVLGGMELIDKFN